MKCEFSLWEALAAAVAAWFMPSPKEIVKRNLTKGEDKMSEQQLGIKETKEVLVGLNEVSIAIAKRFKDGIQVAQDAEGLYEDLVKDAQVKAVILAAYENAKAVPAELKDLSVMEGVELGMVQAQYIPKIVEALKK